MTAGPRTLFGKVATLSGAGSSTREQTVFTPESILRVVRELWDGSIAYDPCHGHPGQVLTKSGREAVTLGAQPLDRFMAGHATPVGSLVNATAWTAYDGLTEPWPDGTFANPPYDKLKDWLAWSLEQPTDHVMLVPVRPHRKWWRAWARQCDEVVYLNPVTFEGHTQSFPAPLCLARRVTVEAGYPLHEMCRAAGIGESL